MNATTSPDNTIKDAMAPPNVFVDSPASTATGASNESILQLLEAAVAAGDEHVFLRELDKLEKESLTAGDFVQFIKLSLEIGFDLLARRLSAEAHAILPDDALLAKYARILGPPKSIVSAYYTKQNWEANRHWLKQNGANYRGQWVALDNGQFVGAASSPKLLTEELGELSNFFLTIVY